MLWQHSNPYFTAWNILIIETCQLKINGNFINRVWPYQFLTLIASENGFSFVLGKKKCKQSNDKMCYCGQQSRILLKFEM